MICGRCKRRFGKHGENYWSIKRGICGICEEHLKTFCRPASSDKNKKLG